MPVLPLIGALIVAHLRLVPALLINSLIDLDL